MICEKCNNEIPNNEIFYKEYYQINKNLAKYDLEDNFKSFSVYKKIFKTLENNNNIKLCSCIDNFDIKDKILKQLKVLDIKEVKNEHKNLLKVNNETQIVRERLPLNGINDFLKEEKKLFLLRNINHVIFSYEDLKDDIRINNETNGNNMNDMKKTNILIIYDINVLTEINDKHDYYDFQIQKIIEYRIKNGKTTYLLYNSKRTNVTFNSVLKNINHKKINDFYSKINETSDIFIEEGVYKITDLDIVKKSKSAIKKIPSNDDRNSTDEKKKSSFEKDLEKEGLKLVGKNSVEI